MIGGEGREQTTAAKQTTQAFTLHLCDVLKKKIENKGGEKIEGMDPGVVVVVVWLPLHSLWHFFNDTEQTLLINAAAF